MHPKWRDRNAVSASPNHNLCCLFGHCQRPVSSDTTTGGERFVSGREKQHSNGQKFSAFKVSFEGLRVIDYSLIFGEDNWSFEKFFDVRLNTDFDGKWTKRKKKKGKVSTLREKQIIIPIRLQEVWIWQRFCFRKSVLNGKKKVRDNGATWETKSGRNMGRGSGGWSDRALKET